MKKQKTTKDRIYKITDIIAKSGDFEIVTDKVGNKFIAKNNKRFGRDIELYVFLEKVAGLKYTICTFLKEIVFPSNVKEAIEATKKWGLEIYPAHMHEAWLDIFQERDENDNYL